MESADVSEQLELDGHYDPGPAPVAEPHPGECSCAMHMVGRGSEFRVCEWARRASWGAPLLAHYRIALKMQAGGFKAPRDEKSVRAAAERLKSL
jgi:hypothetical protein